MYLMYVDESGDPGLLPKSPCHHFILSGVVVHESKWLETLNHMYDFRIRMHDRFGLNMREEIHTTHFFSRRGGSGSSLRRPNDRLAVYRLLLREIASMDWIRVINILVDKVPKREPYNVFFNAWRALIQRFENTIANGNFPLANSHGEMGILFSDATDGSKLKKMVQGFRKRNIITPGPDRGGGVLDLPLVKIVEDPIVKDSAESYFIQMADVCVFALKQFYKPSSYMRKSGGNRYFNHLDPGLRRAASRDNPYGIVWL